MTGTDLEVRHEPREMAVLTNEQLQLCECGCGHPAPISTRHRPERGQAKGQPVRFIRGHALRGKTLSQKTRQKMSAVRKGKRHTAETRVRMAVAAKRGEESPYWKGAAITYSALHAWLGRLANKTGVCAWCCDAARTDWANISGEYHRDANDFVELCRSCHRRYDQICRGAA